MNDMFLHAEEFLARLAQDQANPLSRATIMEPWISQFVDVPAIHGRATREMESLIGRVKSEGRSKARLLIGDTATGKSHVLARAKNLFAEKAFFSFCEPLTGDGENIFRHLLGNIARDLMREIPPSRQPQFHRVWRDFFLNVASNRMDQAHNFRAWSENRKFDFLCLVDDQLRSAGKEVDFSLLGVLYEYARHHRTNRRLKLAAEKWCRGASLNDEELQLLDLPAHSSLDTEEKAKQTIKGLGAVTSFSRPVFLCFDQVEAYILNDRAFAAFVKAVEYMVDYAENFAIVTAALLTFDEKLRTGGLTPSTWDRFNYKNKPITIHPLTPDEGRQLLAARLAAETASLEMARTRPLFPFCSADVEAILTPPAAAGPTLKQARYILADAETVFDDITASLPTFYEIEKYYLADKPLARPAGSPHPYDTWPDAQAVDYYLDSRLQECMAQYEADPEQIGIDEHRNREIVLDLLFKLMERDTEGDHPRVSNVTVFSHRRKGGCDMALELERPGRKPSTVGLLFSDEARANSVKAVTRKAAEVLESGRLGRLLYVRDARSELTRKGQEILDQFAKTFAKGSPVAEVITADEQALIHLRAARRMFELAASADLVMYNPRLKKEHAVSADRVAEHLFTHARLQANSLMASILGLA